MKYLFSFIATLILLSGCTQKRDTEINVIPIPQKCELTQQAYALSRDYQTIFESSKEVADRIKNYISTTPLSPSSEKLGNSGIAAIVFRITNSIPGLHSPEGYKIETDKNKTVIESTTESGLFYGLQTIFQVIENEGVIPCGVIIDEPRFAYRGMMLDVSRHFFDKNFVKKQIDAMARYKMNRLHIHLTDAAGWRIEIKKYPRLTQMAAWREYPLWKEWWNNGRRYSEEGHADAHGGYYTQEDIREIVKYAAERHITIIPEIEMPAHSEEVLTAYPEISCTHEPYKQADFCIGNEKTFEFLENVLGEIIALFPSEYIHIGGDEATKSSWPTCPLCQERMKEEGMQNVDELQSYLIHRIERFLNSKGRQIIGWDEILDGGLAPNATVMSWRGTEGGLQAIASGHKAIMSPGSYCYLDQYQDAPHTQPEAIGGYLPLKKVYSYNPVPNDIDSTKAQLIYGIQGNLWAEYIPTVQHMERMIYPRILAIAETGWSNNEAKCYEKFRRRALTAVKYLSDRGYTPFDLSAEIGNRPEADEPVEHLAKGKKATYAQEAPYYKDYAAGGDSALVDGVRGAWNNNDGAWQGFIKGGIDVTIDLEEQKEISSIGADFMQICNPWIFMPNEVTIWASTDNENFEQLTHIEHEVVKDDVLSFKNFGWEGKTAARYIRYQAKSSCNGGWLFTDEIVIK